MKKQSPLLFIFIVFLIGSACQLSSIVQKENIEKTDLSDEKIDQVVQNYFSDQSGIQQDAYEFLTGIGFKEISFSINESTVILQFEQFDDLLPEQMQQRYLIAFLTAERYQPNCQMIEVTVTVAGAPMIKMIGACTDVRAWRHGELDVQAWFNRIKKTVVWNPPQIETKEPPPLSTTITDPYSWFLDNPQVLGAVFRDYGIPLEDSKNFYYSLYETDDNHICSYQTNDGNIYQQYHEDNLLWINGTYDMGLMLSELEQMEDHKVSDVEQGFLDGKQIVAWSISFPPDFLREEKHGYIELVPGSDEWFGFIVTETCLDQFGNHLPSPVDLLQVLLEEMNNAGYQ